jgi:L-fuconolactonase
MKTLLRSHGSRMIVDHMGLPARGELASAQAWLAEIAAFPNCYIKVAGLARASGETPPYQDLWPLLETLVRHFGSARLLWGSDYPSTQTPADYRRELESMESLPFLSSDDRDRMLGGTACGLWGVPAGARLIEGHL